MTFLSSIKQNSNIYQCFLSVKRNLSFMTTFATESIDRDHIKQLPWITYVNKNDNFWFLLNLDFNIGDLLYKIWLKLSQSPLSDQKLYHKSSSEGSLKNPICDCDHCIKLHILCVPGVVPLRKWKASAIKVKNLRQETWTHTGKWAQALDFYGTWWIKQFKQSKRKALLRNRFSQPEVRRVEGPILRLMWFLVRNEGLSTQSPSFSSPVGPWIENELLRNNLKMTTIV